MDTAPTATAPGDPVEILRGLTAEGLRERIQQLDAERVAVAALLRGVLARDRSLQRKRGSRNG
jgi:hypothetical protein